MESHQKHAPNNEVLFFERHAAAQSLKNFWTRLASTYGCIMVVLYRKTLMIKPHAFAKWFIHLLGLDLTHEIPVKNIRDVVEMGKWFSYGKVELRFETPAGEDQRIWLYLKKHKEFIEKTTSAIDS